MPTNASTSLSFGKKAAELVREIVESDPETLPPYNADAMRTIVEQCGDHRAEIVTLAPDASEDATRVGLLAHHQVRGRGRAREEEEEEEDARAPKEASYD